MKLSLVIPCFNEAKGLPTLLDRCRLLSNHSDIEIIFVDNGSTDNTSEIFADMLPKYPGFRSIRIEINQGYGYGILAGLREAKGRIIGWTHADMQTDPVDVIKGLSLFDQYGDNILVKGLRYGRPITDRFFTIGMSLFETLLLQQPLRDINAQPTLFSRTFFETWTNPPYDFSLDLYAYFLARKSGLSICRFKVIFWERAFGISRWNVDWSAKKKFIYRTLKYSFNLRKLFLK